jgi:type I restriction-modification system DNA methylase subunit
MMSSAALRRDALRGKGQFWTPTWVAEAVVHYLLPHCASVFDPCVGDGAFFRAVKTVSRSLNLPRTISGTDIVGEFELFDFSQV